jgi:hypothetical protein
MTEATAEEMVASIRESLSAPREIARSAARCDAQHTSGVPRCLAAAKPTHLLDEESGEDLANSITWLSFCRISQMISITPAARK